MKIAILPAGGGEGKNLTGINRSTIGMLTELQKQGTQNEYYLLGDAAYLGLSVPTIRLFSHSQKPVINYAVCAYGVDIIHSHSGMFEVSSGISCGRVLTIHDLGQYIYPEWFGQNAARRSPELLRKCAHTMDVIIADSEYTKKDIIDLLNIPEEKIRVVYLGLYPAELYRESELGDRVDGVEPDSYLLAVSGMNYNKNYRGLVQAYYHFREAHPSSGLKLVLTGPIRSREYEQEVLGGNNRFREDIIYTGYVSDRQLVWLYRNALAYANVSFYEGFGLPVLEAMALGKAVVCANATSLPEVGGDAVEYCDPANVESIMYAFENVILNEARRRELEQKALIQAQKFSYEKAAQETLEIYNEFRRS